MVVYPKDEIMSLGFYSKSEAYLISLCPDRIFFMSGWDQMDMGSDGHGIGRTWDPFWDCCDLPYDSFWERMDMGLDGHGIPSRIAVTFRMHLFLEG
jgi:hypothetical protein